VSEETPGPKQPANRRRTHSRDIACHGEKQEQPVTSERFTFDDARGALRLACRSLGVETVEGTRTPARTSLAQSVVVRGRRYFILAERLFGVEAARERLVHLRRRLDLWEHDGAVEEDIAGCLGIAKTVEEPPPRSRHGMGG
jgi:hypothetical protein